MKLEILSKDRQAELILQAEQAGHTNPATYLNTLLSEIVPGDKVVFKKVEPLPDGSYQTTIKYHNPEMFPDYVFITKTLKGGDISG